VNARIKVHRFERAREDRSAMKERKKKKELSILRVLRNSGTPMTSAMITQELVASGQEISERTVRLYLQEMSNDGLTTNIGKKGHQISEKGLGEFDSANIIDKVGFLSAKIDTMTYQMDFDLNTTSGNVVINVTLVEPGIFAKSIPLVSRVYKEGYAMGHLLTFLGPGETLGHISVPEGMIGVGTVCSITMNGVLLKHAIPTTSRFGGLLELREGKPVRFAEIIMYDGTSIDPLEIFIRSGMTNYIGAVQTGNGRIGASFREFPAESRDMVEHIDKKMKRIGLGGLLRIGMPGHALLDIPVSEGRVGAIVIGGLNPVSIMEETGARLYSRALAGLIDFRKLFRYEEMESRIRPFL
jgi:hypothetical protein